MKTRAALIIIGLGVLLCMAVIISITLGRFSIGVSEIGRLLRGLEPSTDQIGAIFFNVRLPRIIMACLVGCCLSVAGASYQGVFQNPMAAPDILGASSGAATGAALAIWLELSSQMVMIFAFAFSFGTIALVMFVSRAAKGSRLIGIVLAGIMIRSIADAVTSFIKLVADPNNILPEITFWMMGSLAKTTPQAVSLALIPMALGIVPLLLLRWRINVLTLSDDEAKSVGVNVRAVRFAVIVCSTLITAASVSVSGLIGWVGLVIPHLTRRLVGNDYRYLTPACMLGGGLFLLLVDDVSRNLFMTEIPIGILTSVIGAPFFIWLITRKSEAL
jgi:iron complex transport system permease protein